jgi:hypothetical protein
VACFCEHGNEPWVFVKGGEFLSQVNKQRGIGSTSSFGLVSLGEILGFTATSMKMAFCWVPP